MTVLVQHHAIEDQETGGSYTVKKFNSSKVQVGDSWVHKEIRLEPANPDSNQSCCTTSPRTSSW